ncbi:MAG TPA: hypothetical protein VNY36_08130 [Bacteroidia bacterium]|jgi:hypothetical protein|nr:hypothetical protein [Bacteroidia bacterium]
MIKKLFFILTLLLCVIVCKAQVRHKMFVGSNNTGQYKLNIIPVKYDTTVSDLTILKCIDSLPGGLFHAKMYNLLYADDSTRMAIQVNEGTYLFHTRYEVVEYYKNGAIKRRTYYNKHEMKYWYMSFYPDASPKEKGRYQTSASAKQLHSAYFDINCKKGKWQYFNIEGNMVKMERYNRYGQEKTKDYNPPKRNFTTIMNPKKPKGKPYVIQ